MIEVDTPDGGVAEFPDGTPPDVIKGALRKRFPPPQTVADGKTDRERSWGETAQDMLASGAQGFQTGFQGLLGSLGDAQQMSGDIAAWGAGKLGFSPDTQGVVRTVASKLPTLGMPINAPTTKDVNSAFESVIGKYSPQTDAGRYAQGVGEFVPAAMAGPGGAVRKTAMSVIPGIATTLTGDLTDQNPYAKTAVGLATGILTAGRGKAGTIKAVREAPTAEKIAADTDAAYTTLRNAGIAYDNNAYSAFVNDLTQQMKARGYRPRANSPHPISADLEELAAAANNPLDFSEVESLRKSIGKNLPVTASKEDRAAAQFVKDKFDEFMGSAPLVTNGTVSEDQVKTLTKQARELASRNIKNRTLEEAISNARLAASGFENGLRIEVRKILKNPNRLRGFSTAEKNAMLSIAGGTTPQNLMAQFGRLGISLDKLTSKASLLPALVGGAATTAGVTLPGVGIVGAATAAKYGSRLMAEKSAKDLMALSRAGRAAQEQAALRDAVSKQEAIARGALSADAALNSGGPSWFLQDATGRKYSVPR